MLVKTFYPFYKTSWKKIGSILRKRRTLVITVQKIGNFIQFSKACVFTYQVENFTFQCRLKTMRVKLWSPSVCNFDERLILSTEPCMLYIYVKMQMKEIFFGLMSSSLERTWPSRRSAVFDKTWPKRYYSFSWLKYHLNYRTGWKTRVGS